MPSSIIQSDISRSSSAITHIQRLEQRLRYKIEDQPDGKVMVSGTVIQKNAPENWVMVLPVRFSFGDKQTASGTVLVQGPSSPFQIRLPMRPKNVELDPDRWILADGISTTKGN